jgi:hypothetical protein
VWISNGCLGACLLICNPLVNSAWDAMLCAIFDFFIIGHLLASANMNEWVEVIVAEAEWVSEGHVVEGSWTIGGDGERGLMNIYISYAHVRVICVISAQVRFVVILYYTQLVINI